jgi:amino acid permease
MAKHVKIKKKNTRAKEKNISFKLYYLLLGILLLDFLFIFIGSVMNSRGVFALLYFLVMLIVVPIVCYMSIKRIIFMYKKKIKSFFKWSVLIVGLSIVIYSLFIIFNVVYGLVFF